MEALTAVALDIARSVFQVHGVDAADGVVIRQQGHAWSTRNLGMLERIQCSDTFGCGS